MPTFKIAASAMLTGLIILHSPARAQAIEDNFWLQVSAYKAHVDTDISISPASSPGSGTGVNLEGDLGFDDSELLASATAGARLGGGFILGAEYYTLHRDTTATLNREIQFEDVVYPIYASVTAGFGTDIYRATIGWAFVTSRNVEIGGAIGLHATDIGFSIEGRGSVDGSTLQSVVQRKDLLAPLPTVGLFVNWQTTPRFKLGVRSDFLSLTIDKYSGRLINTQATASYRLTRNLGVGVMYRYVDYRLDVKKRDYVGRFTYTLSGPAAFLELGF